MAAGGMRIGLGRRVDPLEWPWPALCMPVGPPGCGKSTLGRRLAEMAGEAGRRLAVVSRDQGRLETTGAVNDFGDEAAVSDWVARRVAEAARGGSGVYLDQTSLSARLRRADLRRLRGAWEGGVAVVGLLWAGGVGVAELMERNARRAASGRPVVPLEDVERMARAWERVWPAHLAAEGCGVVCVFSDDGVFEPEGPGRRGAGGARR